MIKVIEKTRDADHAYVTILGKRVYSRWLSMASLTLFGMTIYKRAGCYKWLAGLKWKSSHAA